LAPSLERRSPSQTFNQLIGKAVFVFSPLSGIKLDMGSMIIAPGGCTPNAFLNGCQ
jgi:hypothetical protein